MKLPYRKKASIPRVKLTNYLLSETHPVGSSKSRFFRKLGFNESNIEEFARLLLEIRENNIEDVKELEYGTNYVINGTIETPSGKTVKITTVWFIKKGGNEPRFVTAYPV